MRKWAYAARYGKQQLPYLMQMTNRELDEFNDALEEIIRAESGKSGEGDDLE